MNPQSFTRCAGVALPLFALRSADDAGSGTILDLLPFLDWLAEGGQKVLQLLPLNECPPAEMSPYTALSAFAFEPEHIRADAIDDVRASGAAQDWLRQDRIVRFLGRMRRSRRRWRRAAGAFQRQLLQFGFDALEQHGSAERHRRFADFCRTQAGWLDAYARFRALHEQHGERPWWEWPDDHHVDPQRQRFAKYVQWVAAEQWGEARRHAAACGVALKGDLAFVCGRDSADVWAHQDQFDPSSTIGTPPDAFSATGQNWSLPLYDWSRMRQRGFDWWRARAAHAASMYDMVRIDHVVGLFRTYAIPLAEGGTQGFVPAAEHDQYHLGCAVLDAILEAAGDCGVIAEDLGSVPDWVRTCLNERRIPGYRVFRWETAGADFIDPREFRELSVATTSTHDTETLAQWIDELDDQQRAAAQRLLGEVSVEAVLQRLYDSGSALVILPLQDLFGWRDRINVPATSNRQNWSYRLPAAVAELRQRPEVTQRWREVRQWAEQSGR